MARSTAGGGVERATHAEKTHQQSLGKQFDVTHRQDKVQDAWAGIPRVWHPSWLPGPSFPPRSSCSLARPPLETRTVTTATHR